MSDRSDVRIIEPVPYTVVQRRGYDRRRAHPGNPGGPVLGRGRLRLSFQHGAPPGSAYGLRLAGASVGIEVRRSGDRCSAEIDLPAGGWYRGELFATAPGGSEERLADVGPVGVGEVYVIAGQSYAGNWNDERLRVLDPEGRVAALDPRTGAWRVAHDPQPLVAEDNGTFGSIWPEAMGLLLPVVGVPVGMANVSVGATASRQWLPDTPLFANLERICRLLGDFRAVLWQQGESDILEGVDGGEWEARISGIKAELDRRLGFSRPWMPAKSTLHPTVYHLPDREQAIRDAVERLWSSPGFLRGPDTDVLGGENRSGPEGRRHFSAQGQRRAGLLWFSALWSHLGSLGGEE